jgi:hypothetical protein
MTPVLKAPGTKRLKLLYDGPPSNFAFNFNLCRYSLGELLSGETATSPVVITLRDLYNQTASSGDGASAALIASYSSNVTLSAGSRAVMVGRSRLTI